MADPEKCYIRVLNAISDTPAMDLYVNNELIATDFKYKDFSKYFEALPGIYNFKVVPTNDPDALILSQNISLDDQVIYTLCLIGTMEQVNIELIADRKKDIDKSKAYIRYINLSPGQTEFDFIMNGKMIVDNLKYQETSGYLPFSPGQYNLTVKNSISNRTVIVHPRLVLSAEKEYAGYIVGVEQTQQNLEILIPLEGSSYLNF